MQKRAKNEVFGHFLKFGTSDRLEIACDGSPKCFSSYGSGHLSSLILLNCTSEVGSQSVKFLISSFSCQIVRYLTVQAIDFLISSLQAIDLISSLQAIDFLISSFSPAIDYLGAIDYY